MIEQVRNGSVGKLFWKNSETTGNGILAVSPLIINAPSSSYVENVTFGDVTLIMPEVNEAAITFTCATSDLLNNVTINNAFVSQNVDLFGSGGNCVIVEGQDSQIVNLNLALRGTTERSVVLIGSDSDNCYVGYRLTGALQNARVGSNSTDPSKTSFVQDLTLRRGDNELGSLEHYSDITGKGFIKADIVYSHSSQSGNSKFTDLTSYSEDVQLPGTGEYIVVAKWLDGAQSNGRIGRFLVSVGNDRGSYGDAQKATNDFVIGTVCTDVGASVTSTGLLTLTSDWSVARSCGLTVKFTKIGAD